EGENGDTRITDCDDTDWRNRVTKIKSQGGAGSTTRAVEVAVAASGLTCVNASRKGAGGMNVYYADGTTVSGDTAEVRELSGIDPGLPSDAWGMECRGGYQRTGCMFSNTGSVGSTTASSDWDVSFDSDYLQGCYSDDEEKNENGGLVITCCR
ncbi:MAG: hypothetical protein HGA33_03800, partial [Candidatus Moranbacteria bacterium]|nr:hypothetical protein [Candidatus Moranbacteria bacterium]